MILNTFFWRKGGFTLSKWTKYKESKFLKKILKISPLAIKLPNMLFSHLKGSSRSNVTRIPRWSFLQRGYTSQPFRTFSNERRWKISENMISTKPGYSSTIENHAPLRYHESHIKYHGLLSKLRIRNYVLLKGKVMR